MLPSVLALRTTTSEPCREAEPRAGSRVSLTRLGHCTYVLELHRVIDLGFPRTVFMQRSSALPRVCACISHSTSAHVHFRTDCSATAEASPVEKADRAPA